MTATAPWRCGRTADVTVITQNVDDLHSERARQSPPCTTTCTAAWLNSGYDTCGSPLPRAIAR